MIHIRNDIYWICARIHSRQPCRVSRLTTGPSHGREIGFVQHLGIRLKVFWRLVPVSFPIGTEGTHSLTHSPVHRLRRGIAVLHGLTWLDTYRWASMKSRRESTSTWGEREPLDGG